MGLLTKSAKTIQVASGRSNTTLDCLCYFGNEEANASSHQQADRLCFNLLAGYGICTNRLNQLFVTR